jgi:calcineurin-like phosphoesterase family protein
MKRERQSKLRKIWIIADTHICHKKLINAGLRSPQNDQLIKKYWQNLVFSEDVIYHLGDVFLGKKKEFSAWISDLPGTKVLIRGNHDKESTQWYMNRGFASVLEHAAIIINMKNKGGTVTKTRVYLSHKPMTIPQTKDMLTINIHGHFHNCGIAVCNPLLVKLITENHYLFSLEHVKYKPQLLDRTFLDDNLIQGE